MTCDRCNRRPATHRLTVDTRVRYQCAPCASVGGDLALAFGFVYFIEPLSEPAA